MRRPCAWPCPMQGVDRFHVMKAVNEDLKRLKNNEKKALPKAARACHYALLKNEEALSEQQQTTLAAVYAASPRLKQAHQLKEAFRAIFEECTTISKASRRLKAWTGRAYKADLFPTVPDEPEALVASDLELFRATDDQCSL